MRSARLPPPPSNIPGFLDFNSAIAVCLLAFSNKDSVAWIVNTERGNYIDNLEHY